MRIKVILESEDEGILLTDGSPPTDALGVEMVVTLDTGEEKKLLSTHQTTENGWQPVRLVAKLWADPLADPDIGKQG